MRNSSILYPLESYAAILRVLLKQGYRFCPFEASDLGPATPAAKRCFLRHDVDYSLDWALQFARIDADLEVKSTFSILLRAKTYNVLDYRNLDIVKRIHDLGHDIVLHFAIPESPPSLDTGLLSKMVSDDFGLLKQTIPFLRPAFSWHNVPRGIMDITRGFEVPGLVNIYSKRYIEDMPYRSDSNVRNSVEDFVSLIHKAYPEIHLLLHPYLWLSDAETLSAKMLLVLRKLFGSCEEAMRDNRDYSRQYPFGMEEGLLDKMIDLAFNSLEQ